MVWFFMFFLISGFCSILYEIVWLRLAMAQFGVTSALASIVISVFMAGLGLGSWGSGRLIRKYENRVRVPALRLYALAELLIGISALLVPTSCCADEDSWSGREHLLPGPTISGLVSGSLSPWFRGAPAWERRYRWPCSRSGVGIQSARSDHSAIFTCPTYWAR